LISHWSSKYWRLWWQISDEVLISYIDLPHDWINFNNIKKQKMQPTRILRQTYNIVITIIYTHKIYIKWLERK
jgi:hypothetical protein